MSDSLPEPDLTPFAIQTAKQAALVANYCDHAEHNEDLSQDWLLSAAGGLREIAIELADALGVELVECYAKRIATIEAKSVHSRPGGFDGAHAIRTAQTWRDLQLAQLDHDRVYHPDVFGLTKADQLRHYALHLIKLAGAIARSVDDDAARRELIDRRLPDTLVFAIKVASVSGTTFSAEPLGHSARTIYPLAL